MQDRIAALDWNATRTSSAAAANTGRRGSRGLHRVTVRHGVTTVTRGERFTLGIVYHDAE